MASVHGKDAYVSVDAVDISTYVKKVDWDREADTHDNTGFGKESKTYVGGLKDGTASLEGTYDSTAVSGPAAALEPLLGTVVELVYRPEGTGSGKPEKTVDVVVKKYKESTPVDDLIMWTCEVQFSDDVAVTAQGA